MQKQLIYITLKRLRQFNLLIIKAKERYEFSAYSPQLKEELNELIEQKKYYLKELFYLKNNHLSFLNKVILMIKGYTFLLSEKWRQYQEGKFLIENDKNNIHDFLEKNNCNFQDYQLNIEITKVENNAKELIGERNIFIKNNKTNKGKKYHVEQAAARTWFIELKHDLDFGYFEKVG